MGEKDGRSFPRLSHGSSQPTVRLVHATTHLSRKLPAQGRSQASARKSTHIDDHFPRHEKLHCFRLHDTKGIDQRKNFVANWGDIDNYAFFCA